MIRVKLLRDNVGITQAELAKKLNVTQGAVSQWEKGESSPSIDKLPELAKIFKCTIDELYEKDDG